MKIVVDENMPHARELFAEFGEVIPLPGRQMQAADLRRPTCCWCAPSPGWTPHCWPAAHDWASSAPPPSAPITDKGLLAEGIPFFSAPAAANIRSATMCSPPCWYWPSAMSSTGEMSLAVIGAGNTGECVAGKAEALGMRVLRCDPPRARRRDQRDAVCRLPAGPWRRHRQLPRSHHPSGAGRHLPPAGCGADCRPP